MLELRRRGLTEETDVCCYDSNNSATSRIVLATKVNESDDDSSGHKIQKKLTKKTLLTQIKATEML